MLCDNDVESICVYLSLLQSDSIITLLNYNINQKYLDKLVQNYKPDYIFCKKKSSLILDDFENIFTFFNYYLLKKKKHFEKKFNDNLSLLITTSGTTGSPKFVRLSKENVRQNTLSIIDALPIKKSDITITTLPMSYVYGLSIINTHISRGASILLNKQSVLQKTFWNNLNKFKINSFGGVPYIYSLIEKLKIDNLNLKNLRYVTQAGGKLEKNITISIKKILDMNNTDLYIMYGAAEATSRMSVLNPKYLDSKLGSIGKAIKNGKFEIVNNENKKINKSNVIGELTYKGKNVFMGYSNNLNDLSLGDEKNNYLKTGDLAYRDIDGFYYLIGRKDRYIKIFGHRINLDELEEIIYNYGLECVCSSNNINKIYINTIKKDKNLIKYLSTTTNLHPSIFVIKKVDQFKINENLKIKYE